MIGTTVTLRNFPDPFHLPPQVLVVLNFLFPFVFHSDAKRTSNINNQRFAVLSYPVPQYVRLVMFNLVVSLNFEVPQQLVISGFIQWFPLMIAIIFIPWTIFPPFAV